MTKVMAKNRTPPSISFLSSDLRAIKISSIIDHRRRLHFHFYIMKAGNSFFIVCLLVYSTSAWSFQPLGIHIKRQSKRFSQCLQSTSSVTEEVSIAGGPAITVRDLICTFDGGDTYQLDSASYILQRGARVGLVGKRLEMNLICF